MHVPKLSLETERSIEDYLRVRTEDPNTYQTALLIYYNVNLAVAF